MGLDYMTHASIHTPQTERGGGCKVMQGYALAGPCVSRRDLLSMKKGKECKACVGVHCV